MTIGSQRTSYTIEKGKEKKQRWPTKKNSAELPLSRSPFVHAFPKRQNRKQENIQRKKEGKKKKEKTERTVSSRW